MVRTPQPLTGGNASDEKRLYRTKHSTKSKMKRKKRKRKEELSPTMKYLKECLMAAWRFIVRWTCLIIQFLKSIDSLILAIATALIAWIAIWQWSALDSTDRTLRETLVAANRAWLAPRVGLIDEAVIGLPVKVKVGFDNTGHEPALNILVTNDFLTAAPPLSGDKIERYLKDHWDRCKKTQPDPGNFAVFPSAYIPQEFNLTQVNITTSTTWDADLENNTKLFIWVGCAAYETFHAAHHSSFCFYHGGADAPRLIQDKVLMPISESACGLRNSMHHPGNAG
jgi:hypothetical protein